MTGKWLLFLLSKLFIYLFNYATCKHALLHLNQKYILVQFPFLQFGVVVVVVVVVILIDSHCFLYLFCSGLFPFTRPSP